MQGLDATLDEVSFYQGGDDSRRTFRNLALSALALASVGCVAAYVLHERYAASPAATAALPPGAPATEDPAKLFGAIIVEPEWAAASKLAENTSTQMSLQAEPPSPVPAPAPPSPSVAALPSASDESAPPPTAAPLPAEIPLPPVRDFTRLDDSAPLPPPRPADLNESVETPEQAPLPPPPVAKAVPAPADNGNLWQKLFGFGHPSSPPVASAPTRAPSNAVASAPATAVAPAPSAPAASSARASGGFGGLGALFAGFHPAIPSLDRLGYDRETAIYDISARVVYLPDGSRLEAHSGLGSALDNPSYVSERMRGPTPPHLYELTMREGSFHGVQALRLTPVGEGGIYGRAGLLAHPYMLGPNGDSNGCVSVKEYDAFLKAYENGQIRKLAVVTRL